MDVTAFDMALRAGLPDFILAVEFMDRRDFRRALGTGEVGDDSAERRGLGTVAGVHLVRHVLVRGQEMAADLFAFQRGDKFPELGIQRGAVDLRTVGHALDGDIITGNPGIIVRGT